jgi:gliding motility-associated-like protein
VNVTDSAGCAGSDTVSLGTCSQIYIPNAFRPNMDGTNDHFRPVAGGSTLLDFNMVIYNRWGQKIFETSDFLIGWDGNLNGNDVLPGLYTYLISYRLADPLNPGGGEKTKLRGTVTLVR